MSTDATITITKFPSKVAGASQGIGGPGNNGGSAVTVTVGTQSSAAAVHGSSSGGSSSNLGLKVGLGVGVPFALAILGALLFLIFRRRKSSTLAPAPTNLETSANNPNAAAAIDGRAVSELPPYAANSMAAAGLGKRLEESVITPVSPGSELPARQYSVSRYYPTPSQSPGPQSTYSGPSPPQQMAQFYVPPAGYQAQEMYAEQHPQQHQRMGSMGYSPQNVAYAPQNPQEVGASQPQELGYQAQPGPMTYQAQTATRHEMFVPHDREGVMSYHAIRGVDQYLNEAETRANTHELS